MHVTRPPAPVLEPIVSSPYNRSVIWEPAILGVVAAVAGVVFRRVTGLVAERTGHSRAKAEYAVGSAGVSLVLDPSDRSTSANTPSKRPC